MTTKINTRVAATRVAVRRIDDPDPVTVTGRAERVQTPTQWKQGWRKYKGTILSLGIPLLVILFFVILLIFHHPAPHR